MKSFFEFLGFVSTALISGFLVFSYVGHKKNADKPAMDGLAAAFDKEEAADLPQMTPVSSSRTAIAKDKKKTQKSSDAAYAAGRTAAPLQMSAAASERLKNLYADGDFVSSVVKKWKEKVADAAETHAVKPQLLMGNIVVKSYLGSYSARDFNRDVSEHAGDLALPSNTAVKTYDYAWSVAKIVQQYNLAKYFHTAAPVAAAKVTPSFTTAGPSKKAVSVSQQKSKPAASLAPAEAGFRDLVAKEEGFTSWQGLQRLGDIETKKRADKRVKLLLGASRVR